jgi:16S rRNA (cytidine1402-2'-O)-methyltransferase
MQGGATVVLVSDAGMPGVSDPGYRLIRAAIDAHLSITVAPGPSAVLTALVLSGLPVDRFCFEGFLSRRGGERRARIAELVYEPRTLVFFEAPHRIVATLADLAEAFGARQAAICRELTKTYEEVIRGDLVELAQRVTELRGEITLVVEGRTTPQLASADPAMLAEEVARRVEAGADRKEALTEVAAEAGVSRRVVYDAVVAAKRAP